MKLRWLGGMVGAILPSLLMAEAGAPNGRGPYARIAVLRPHDGHTVDFEAGYIRHLTGTGGPRIPGSGMAGPSGRGNDSGGSSTRPSATRRGQPGQGPVLPAEDERDNVANVAPHAQLLGNALYEYLADLSRGTGEPQPHPRLELTTVDLNPGAAAGFEAALRARRSALPGETLWFRDGRGGNYAPRYVRLRPRASLSAILDELAEAALPEGVDDSIAKATVEILTLRPTSELRPRVGPRVNDRGGERSRIALRQYRRPAGLRADGRRAPSRLRSAQRLRCWRSSTPSSSARCLSRRPTGWSGSPR